MLSKQLKDMERDKLLIKKISKTETLNTEYSLTDFGKSTVPIVKSLMVWMHLQILQHLLLNLNLFSS